GAAEHLISIPAANSAVSTRPSNFAEMPRAANLALAATATGGMQASSAVLIYPPMANLPAFVNAFVGRERQLEVIDAAIRSNAGRLLTADGPGWHR
ncbi:MAG: hypothetical protein J2P17_27190, partial [Mycobacterium sp.]|nr:hypothetical protein [Mycobacterium sp.]